MGETGAPPRGEPWDRSLTVAARTVAARTTPSPHELRGGWTHAPTAFEPALAQPPGLAAGRVPPLPARAGGGHGRLAGRCARPGTRDQAGAAARAAAGRPGPAAGAGAGQLAHGLRHERLAAEQAALQPRADRVQLRP